MDENAATEIDPKKGAKKKIALALVILLCGVLSFILFCPWLDRPHATVEVAGRNEALQAQLDDMARRVKALEERVDHVNTSGPAAPAVVSAPEDTTAKSAAAGLAHMQNEMIALSSAMAALQTEVKATNAAAAEARDLSANLAASIVAFMELRDAASSGHLFADQLARLRDAAKNDAPLQASLAKLEPYAATGVPTLASLHDDLLERRPEVAAAIAKGAAQNWWQRIKAVLQRLITVRSLRGENDALSDLDKALSSGNAAKALEAFKQLPADAQNSLADWRKELEARARVDESIASISARFTSGLEVKTP